MTALVEWLEIASRWGLGLQLVFWGLNGFFHWKTIPPSSEFINRFCDVCASSRFIMPFVKVFEVIFGLFLILNFKILLSLVCLGPIIFVVTGLHVLHNPKWWEIIIPITLPYTLLILFHEVLGRLT